MSQAAVTEHHSWVAVNSKSLLSPGSAGQGSEVEALAGPDPGSEGGAVPGSLLALVAPSSLEAGNSVCTRSPRVSVSKSPVYRTPTILNRGPPYSRVTSS